MNDSKEVFIKATKALNNYIDELKLTKEQSYKLIDLILDNSNAIEGLCINSKHEAEQMSFV